jgi:hypothetical protein
MALAAAVISACQSATDPKTLGHKSTGGEEGSGSIQGTVYLPQSGGGVDDTMLMLAFAAPHDTSVNHDTTVHVDSVVQGDTGGVHVDTSVHVDTGTRVDTSMFPPPTWPKIANATIHAYQSDVEIIACDSSVTPVTCTSSHPEGAVDVVVSDSLTLRGVPSGVTTSDANGQFELKDLKPWVYFLVIDPPAGVKAQRSVTFQIVVQKDQVTHADVFLWQLFTAPQAVLRSR